MGSKSTSAAGLDVDAAGSMFWAHVVEPEKPVGVPLVRDLERAQAMGGVGLLTPP